MCVLFLAPLSSKFGQTEGDLESTSAILDAEGNHAAAAAQRDADEEFLREQYAAGSE